MKSVQGVECRYEISCPPLLSVLASILLTVRTSNARNGEARAYLREALRRTGRLSTFFRAFLARVLS